MKFNIEKLNDNLKIILEKLSKEYNFEISKDGIVLEFEKIYSNNVVSKLYENKLNIKADDVPRFLRAFSEFLKTGREINTKYNLKKMGVMIDNSRNGITNVEYTKHIIEKLAFMGHNTLYLYLEDTYKLENQPYFGYMRGGYTREELKEIDDYANLYGIEVVPCIQTLAHLNQFLYWEHIAEKYADIDDILCVGDSEVLKLIEEMLTFFKTTLRSKRIHLGMDEAYNLGRGKYADINGFEKKTNIMMRHLNDMINLCEKLDLEPIIWDDMFFSNYSKVLKDENIKIPDKISLMYWDYYNSNENHYIEKFEKRKQISDKVMFAGGAWKWIGYTPHHSKTEKTMKASLNASIKSEIEEYLITSWADDGSESPQENMLFGCVLGANYNYNINDINKDYIFYLGVEYEDLKCVEDLDFIKNTDKDQTPSKYILYDDLIQSKFFYHYDKVKIDIRKEYYEMYKRYRELENKYKDNKYYSMYFSFYKTYAKLLSIKSNLAKDIREDYLKDEKLKENRQRIMDIKEELQKFIKKRKRIWVYENKRQGLEVLEYRIGAMIYRLDSILEDYGINKDFMKLYEEKLPVVLNNEDEFVHYNRSQRIMSAGKMIW